MDETENSVSADQDGNEDDEATSKPQITPQARKHGRESTANGLGLDIPTSAPAAKRVRRSHGSEYATPNGHSMEIDQNGERNYDDLEVPEPISSSHSPGLDEEKPDGMEVDRHAPEQARMTPTLNNGQSVGGQSDKVTELASETTLVNFQYGKHVIHTAWNPQDPGILAIAGEALCRIWNLAKRPPTSDDSPPGEFHDLLEPSETALVTTIAWSPDGETLAMATQDTQKTTMLQIGLVSLFTKGGMSIDELHYTGDGVITFKWNPTGEFLLGIISSGASESTLRVWNVRESDIKSYLRLDGVVRDAAWIGKTEFVICGHDIIRYFNFDGQHIILGRDCSEDKRKHNWSHIRYDIATNTTAIAAEEESILAIISSSDELHTTHAHEEDITALEYRPIPNPLSVSLTSPCLLATSSLDGKIKLWDAQKPFHVVTTLELGRESPPIAISFTPDGYLVAAANWNKVLIWNPEYSSAPKARWKGKPEQWQSVAMNGLDHDSGIGEEEEQIPQHSLSWDVDGGKLAYGLRNQVCSVMRSFATVGKLTVWPRWQF